MSNRVEHRVEASIGGDPGWWMRLVYDTDTPLDVQLWAAPMNVWTFARATLRAGLDFPAGGADSDVLVQPFEDQIVIDLIGEMGGARLTFARTDIIEFLAETEHLVPAGTEQVNFDADRELAELLDGAL